MSAREFRVRVKSSKDLKPITKFLPITKATIGDTKDSTVSKTSATAETAGKTTKVIYENSFVLGPAPSARFSVENVVRVIDSVLAARLSNIPHCDAEMSSRLTKSLSTEIKDRVKTFGYSRYKLVCVVTIGEKRGQSLLVASRCLWDNKTDNHASASYSNAHLFATATVYGLYHE